MARVKNNNLTRGISGIIGKDILFKTWNNQTFVYLKPKNPTKESVRQKENRTKFKMASAYAKHLLEDPQKKEEYKQKAKELRLPNAYTAVVTEYMRTIQIVEPETSSLSGNIGDEIKIIVKKKDFEMEKVKVIISDTQGKVIEESLATKGVGGIWHYKFNNRIRLMSNSCTFKIIAYDRLGKRTEKEFVKRPLVDIEVTQS